MLAPISENEIYPLSIFMQRTGLARAAIRSARRAGLPVRKIGVRSFVLGREFLDWAEKSSQPIDCGQVAV